MLAACRAALALEPYLPADTFDGHAAAALRTIRAAITKATGEGK